MSFLLQFQWLLGIFFIAFYLKYSTVDGMDADYFCI